jgi:chitin synthase
VFAFVMLNALFVLVVFLLQLNKENLHIEWTLNAKNEIIYNEGTFEILIRREYLELEPIGLLFVVFFGLIILIQFTSMLIHRFGTISQILANTSLDLYCSKKAKDLSQDAELRENAVEIARRLQRPKPQWDESNPEREQREIGRRETIHRILYQHKNAAQDWSNLEANFKREFYKDGDLNLGQKLSISRKTMHALDTKRKSMAEQRKIRKSVMQSNAQFDEPTLTDSWYQARQMQAPPPGYETTIPMGQMNLAYEADETSLSSSSSSEVMSIYGANAMEMTERPTRRMS